MRLYAQLGRRGAALRQYQVCVAALERELHTEPESETKALYQEILRRQPDGGRARRSRRTSTAPAPASAARSIAAAPETPLVGRESELALLGEALDRSLAGDGRPRRPARRGGHRQEPARRRRSRRSRRPAGCQVMLGRCYETEQALPFAPVGRCAAQRAGHGQRGARRRARAGLARGAGAAPPRGRRRSADGAHRRRPAQPVRGRRPGAASPGGRAAAGRGVRGPALGRRDEPSPAGLRGPPAGRPPDPAPRHRARRGPRAGAAPGPDPRPSWSATSTWSGCASPPLSREDTVALTSRLVDARPDAGGAVRRSRSRSGAPARGTRSWRWRRSARSATSAEPGPTAARSCPVASTI